MKKLCEGEGLHDSGGYYVPSDTSDGEGDDEIEGGGERVGAKKAEPKGRACWRRGKAILLV